MSVTNKSRKQIAVGPKSRILGLESLRDEAPHKIQVGCLGGGRSPLSQEMHRGSGGNAVPPVMSNISCLYCFGSVLIDKII